MQFCCNFLATKTQFETGNNFCRLSFDEVFLDQRCSTRGRATTEAFDEASLQRVTNTLRLTRPEGSVNTHGG